jgi:predicted porin
MRLPNRLLVATALAISGAAQAEPDSVVEMYGMAMPFVDSAETTGATSTAPVGVNRPNQQPASAYTGANDLRRTRITVGTSNWGFRGYEALSPQVKLVWQLESAFQIDQNTGPGLGGRDSKVGFRTPWGELFMGQWDTPYKYISLAVNPLRAGYVFDRTAITGNPGFQVPNTTTGFTRAGAKTDASFDRRQGNSIQYWSPNMGGFTLRAAYSVDEGKNPIIAGGPIVSPTIASLFLEYDIGQLSVRYAYEQHNDYFGMTQLGGSAAGTATNTSSKDRANKFVVLYRIGNTRLTGIVEQLEYKNDDSLAGAVSKYKRLSYYGVIEQFFANKSSVFFSYGFAGNGECTRVGGLACTTHALSAKYITAGYIYRFSKRTEGFIAYYRLTNEESAQYSPGPMVNAATIAPGADTTGYGVGMIHYF